MDTKGHRVYAEVIEMRKVTVQIRDPRQFQLLSLKVYRQRAGNASIAYIYVLYKRFHDTYTYRARDFTMRTYKEESFSIKRQNLLIQMEAVRDDYYCTLLCRIRGKRRKTRIFLFPYRFNHHSMRTTVPQYSLPYCSQYFHYLR